MFRFAQILIPSCRIMFALYLYWSGDMEIERQPQRFRQRFLAPQNVRLALANLVSVGVNCRKSLLHCNVVGYSILGVSGRDCNSPDDIAAISH
jgi:hypothetical protein